MLVLLLAAGNGGRPPAAPADSTVGTGQGTARSSHQNGHHPAIVRLTLAAVVCRVLYEPQLNKWGWMVRIARKRARGGPLPAAAPLTEARPRGRPPVISNERLLEVAREVFLEFGIRATTLEVATRAGVAEGTIFHRFKSKDELFRAAMQFDPDQALAFVESLPGYAGKGELRATLVRFAEGFLELGRVAVPVMMRSGSNPESQLCGPFTDERSQRFRRVVRAISAFFEAEMDAGRLRRKNPEVLARMLLGSLHHYCVSELVARDVGGLSLPNFAREVVDVLLAADVVEVGENVGGARGAAARRHRGEGHSK
jgi:AcrR family transcriptional regulator